MICQELQNNVCAIFHPYLPAPVDSLTFVVFSSLETNFLQVVFESPVGLYVFQNNQVNDDIEVERAGVLRNDRRTFRDEVSRCQPPDQYEGVLVRTQIAQQRNQNTFAIPRDLLAVAVQCQRFCYQN